MKNILNVTLVALILSINTSCKTEIEHIRNLEGNLFTKSQLEEFITQQMDSLNVIGLTIAIINDSKIVYNNTLGLANIHDSVKVDSNTIFEAASISKPFFTYFVMKMVDKGVLALDTPLYKYLLYPDIEFDERYKQITARMILCHSTGFPNWRFFYPENKLFIQFDPGTNFYYSGEGFLYLEKVVAHLNGISKWDLDSLIQMEMCTPLGIEHSHFSAHKYITRHKATGYIDGEISNDVWDRTAFSSAGSLHSEAIDYAKFLIAVMNDIGLDSATAVQMLTKQIDIPDDDEFKTDDGYTAWALGFGIKEIKGKTYYGHDGDNWKFQSHFLLNKDQKNGYVFFTNCNKGFEFNKKLEQFLIQ